MVDVELLERQAKEEMEVERGKEVRRQLTDMLKRIAAAEAVVANLRREYEALKLELKETPV